MAEWVSGQEDVLRAVHKLWKTFLSFLIPCCTLVQISLFHVFHTFGKILMQNNEKLGKMSFFWEDLFGAYFQMLVTTKMLVKHPRKRS